MPIKQVMKGIPQESLAAEGIFEQDGEALASHQQECLTRFGMTCQMEQDAYLIMHPEIRAMTTSFVKKMVHMSKRKDILKEAAEYFTRPSDIIDKEIREQLKLTSVEPYLVDKRRVYNVGDDNLNSDLKNIIEKHLNPSDLRESISSASKANTVSSSFVSIITSNTTLPTPEPVPTPEPTLSETMFSLVSNAVDKSVYIHLDEDALRYDTAFVELSKAVEEAMEITVKDIRQDIAELFYDAYKAFETDILAKERLAAEKAWEKRMRKKLKRTLRRINNFKGKSRKGGYETPPTPKSVPSSHESYKIPPPGPCVCHPQYNYNRYPKDRFGIYIPRNTSEFSDHNVTITPALSMESVNNEVAEYKLDRKSTRSKKSFMSNKSTASKKCNFKNVD